MYPEFLNADDLCMALGACALKSLVALPTCDECTGSVAAIGAMISEEEQIMEVVAFLQVQTVSEFPTEIECFSARNYEMGVI